MTIYNAMDMWNPGEFPAILAIGDSWFWYPKNNLPEALARQANALFDGYAIRQWQALTRYTENGILMPDNNLLERQMRPIAMGRKSYLFVASGRGGEVAATLYSLIATCKLNHVEPFAYLKDVLGRIRGHRVDRLAELLPFNWTPAIT